MAPVADDCEIRKILVERIDIGRQSVGMVVGIIEPTGCRIVAHGEFQVRDSPPVDGDTLFEIGSVTKTFTALLLADMVRRGEVAFDDPAAKHLGIKLPERGGRSITLVDLATHTSGLPRLPTNFAPKDVTAPYADYSIRDLDEFLSTHVLSRDIGLHFEYSNLGPGLLGLALARRAGTDYETLVRARIIEPLGMASTAITLSPALQARLAAGHDADLTARVANWHFSEVFVAAGALKSSVNDLLVFLAANLAYAQTPLAPAMADMIRMRRPSDAVGDEVAIGWGIGKLSGTEIITHSGGTGGYHAFIAYSPKARTGIVVLANTAADIDDIGLHLLDRSSPLKKLSKEIAIDPKLLDGYVGRYALMPNFVVTVTCEDGRLFVQATGQSRFAIRPEGERCFFSRTAGAQFTFETDAHGRAVQLMLHQHGKDTPANRIE